MDNLLHTYGMFTNLAEYGRNAQAQGVYLPDFQATSIGRAACRASNDLKLDATSSGAVSAAFPLAMSDQQATSRKQALGFEIINRYRSDSESEGDEACLGACMWERWGDSNSTRLSTHAPPIKPFQCR
jgi:hypothetical protein